MGVYTIVRLVGLALAAVSLVPSANAQSAPPVAPAAASPVAPPAAPPTAVQGKFLHLSDIHFNPLADPSLFAQLNAAPVDQWEAILQTSSMTAIPTGSWEDSNYPLLKSMLAATQQSGPFDYIVYTGDYLSHGFMRELRGFTSDKATQKDFAVKTVDFVNLMIANAFPSLPLVATLGNNDSACDDYNLTPGADILAGVGNDLPVVRQQPSAESDFDAGGYYLVPHPTVANLDFIVLSIFWSKKYVNACAAGAPDPAAAQMHWLTNTLAAEQKAGRRAIVLMHIPPGVDGFSASSNPAGSPPPLWLSSGSFLDDFQRLTAQYKDVLIGGYAGHTHMDEFRVLADSAPYLAIKMAPSVSPYNGNRPAFTVFDYDPATGSALDYTVATLVNYGSTGPGTPAIWSNEYSFAATYGLAQFDAANASTLAAKTRSDPATRSLFGHYYAAGNASRAERSNSWYYFSCALDQLAAKSYQACINATRRGQGGPRPARAQ